MNILKRFLFFQCGKLAFTIPALLPFFVFGSNTRGLQEVSFQSTDDFEITADLYHTSKSAPTIVLFHQSVSSRGEYRTIAPKLKEVGFNCLAVDLRWGKQDFWNKIPNETAKRNGTYEVVDNYENSEEYQLDKVWPIIWQAYEDMKASISYLKEEGYDQEIVVVGSSFSAMLVFKLMSDGLPVDGIAAFSPGEYHPTDSTLLTEWVNDVDVPVYLSAGKEELEMVGLVKKNLSSGNNVTIHHSDGRHGASVLMSHEGDWIPFLNFLNPFLKKKHSIGFTNFKTRRKSRNWSSEGDLKPLTGWLWYPVEKGHGSTFMKNKGYISSLNIKKTEEQNYTTYKAILGGVTEDTLTDDPINRYLNLQGPIKGDDLTQVKNRELIVLSGAHPIYFTELAARLASEGYVVLSLPKTGMREGDRLPFSTDGVREYVMDLGSILDHLSKETSLKLNGASFISWSFEGVPTLQVAVNRKAKKFLSLDSSIGYEYGEELISKGLLNQDWPFQVVHYTGQSMDFGKSLKLIGSIGTEKVEVIKNFDFAHADFTSLSSITI